MSRSTRNSESIIDMYLKLLRVVLNGLGETKSNLRGNLEFRGSVKTDSPSSSTQRGKELSATGQIWSGARVPEM